MSIPDKAVEAARDRVHHFMRGWDQGETISGSVTAEGQAVLRYSDLGTLLDAVEAAEPYLTSNLRVCSNCEGDEFVCGACGVLEVKS